MKNVNRHLNNLERIDALIRKGMAKSPAGIAKQLGLPIGKVNRSLNLMKLRGAPLKHCRKSGIYYYEVVGRMVLGFVEE